MQPLFLNHSAVASGAGIGLDATVIALGEMRSGLAPCGFETVALDTFVGQIYSLYVAILLGQHG